MTNLVGYNGDKAFRTRFLRELAWHARMDAIQQGSYGRGGGKDWKGCAVACGLRSIARIDHADLSEHDADEYADHKALSARLGMPLELAHLQDRLFEGQSRARAKLWPRRFAKAIPVGADLSLVWPRFAVWMLSDPKHGVIRHADDTGKAAIATVVALFERRIAGDEPSTTEWDAAAHAASNAAYAAHAARAAAYAAAYAADAAADAAAYAGKRHYARMADKLVELMEACR